MEAVTLRMVDRVLGETIWEYSLTEEDMERGAYTLSGYDLYAGEFMQKHWDQLMQGYEPDPVLEVSYTVSTDHGPETQTEMAEAAEELWVNARFDEKDPKDDFLASFLEETTYPDSFVARIEATANEGIRMVYGEEAALSPGDVSVTVSVDGQTIPGDGWHMEVETQTYEGKTLYAYALVVPRPDSVPEHGTATVTIRQRLLHHDLAAAKTVNVEY